MKLILEAFVNERYELLKLLCSYQVKVKDISYVTLSQQEIADMAHISKLKANRIINELINLDCIYLYNNKRGKYAITEKGFKILQLIQKSNI